VRVRLRVEKASTSRTHHTYTKTKHTHKRLNRRQDLQGPREDPGRRTAGGIHTRACAAYTSMCRIHEHVPHTRACVLILDPGRRSAGGILRACVVILLYMYTTIYGSSYYYMCPQVPTFLDDLARSGGGFSGRAGGSYGYHHLPLSSRHRLSFRR
jgi:hypothetical protein